MKIIASLFFDTIVLMFLKTLPKDISSYCILIFVVLISTIAVWFPFLFRAPSWLGLKIDNSNFQYIYKQYDGPLYIIPAKTLYDPKKIETPQKGLIISLPLTAGYFAAHFPLYPLAIRLVREVSEFAGGLGYLKSMILVNFLSTIFLTLFFYFFIKKLGLGKNPLLLSIVFLFLPRFLVVRSVGAPESLFLLLILLSLYCFEKNKFWLAGICGGLAAMTKSPGILLFAVYFLVLVERFLKTKRGNWNWLGILGIPLGMLAVFGIYKIQYGDFFAYFHSGDNIHLIGPFSVFNYQSKWVGTAWLEDIIFYFFMGASTLVSLRGNKYRSLFYFSFIFFVATIFVQHRDIARYSLPLWPLTIIAFEKFFSSRKFLIALLILLPALYLYAWNFLLFNIIPISDWGPFL